MEFNSSSREITLKLVYYGPPLSGKTTNLHALHGQLGSHICGKMVTLDTSDDRTLFFDLLPVLVRSRSGVRIKLKLYTVPGQAMHSATRKLVLSGADGLVFVADSQLSLAAENQKYWHGMRQYLRELGDDPDLLPTVVQFNKRDLEYIRSDKDLDLISSKSREPIFRSVAIRSEGVMETLYGLCDRVWHNLDTTLSFGSKLQLSREDFFDGIFQNAIHSGWTVPESTS